MFFNTNFNAILCVSYHFNLHDLSRSNQLVLEKWGGEDVSNYVSS